MKRLLFILLSVSLVSITASAQTASMTKEEAKAAKAAEKEAKAKYKELQTNNIESALKEVGASKKEITAFMETLAEASAKSSTIKKDENLSESEKEEALKATSAAKNEKLKQILGMDRYKAFHKVRKDQKPAEEAIVAPYRKQ